MELEIVKKRLKKVTKPVMQILDSEPAVLKITGPTTTVGDIHGDLDALDFILEQWQQSSTKNILFLGDYVDRGTQSAEALLTLLELKVIDPTHVFLLRGNHEDARMNKYYGFFDEIGKDTTFIMRMHSIFQVMPVAAILNNNIFCVHGGITEATDLNTITKANSFQYLWNDPSYVPGIHYSERGDNIMTFGSDILDTFLKANNFSTLIRAHEYQESGYKWWFDRKLLSLFSSTNYSGRRNQGSFVEYEDKRIKLYIFDSKENIKLCDEL